MKLVRYQAPGAPGPRLGALLERHGTHGAPKADAAADLAADWAVEPPIALVIDLAAAYSAWRREVLDDPFASEIATVRIPADMTRFLEGGARSIDAARAAFGHAQALPLAALLQRGLAQSLTSVALLAPLQRPGKIIGVGANYAGHVQEGRDAGVIKELPPYPVAFLKMSSAVIGPEQAVVRSRHTEELDYEIELSMVIGKRCRDLNADNWRDAVAGFTIVNDISMRDLIVAEKPTGVVFQGKNLDTACPLGPCIVTPDELGDPDALDICLRVNGAVRQQDNTRTMIFSCADILIYWSSRMTLEPGDVVTTGTASGVAGFNRRFPERLLQHGDVIEAEIQGIGILRNPVRDERRQHEAPAPAMQHLMENPASPTPPANQATQANPATQATHE